jgi:hypothetical protein
MWNEAGYCTVYGLLAGIVHAHLHYCIYLSLSLHGKQSTSIGLLPNEPNLLTQATNEMQGAPKRHANANKQQATDRGYHL